MKQRAKQVLSIVRPWLIALPRLQKRLLLVANDMALVTASLWLMLSLRYNQIYVPPSLEIALLLALAPVLAVASFAQAGLYRIVTRYIGHRGTSRIVVAMAVSVLLWALILLMAGVLSIPRTVILTYGVVAAGLIVASRQFAAWLLRTAGVRIPSFPEGPRRHVAIFGAGAHGVQLQEALRRAGDTRIIGFLDDTASLKGQYIGGVKVYPSDKLATLIDRGGVTEVLMALPAAERRERREILKRLERFPVRVRTLPAIDDIASGKVTVNDLRPVDVADLLGRDPVPPVAGLLSRAITGKSVMVTGAGGSIGSELVRQCLKHAPSRLVLFENGESALYEIEMRVTEILAGLPVGRPRPQIVAVLGSVLDEAAVRTTIEAHRVETIYHAAAYKHVPIVELNPIAGIRNNTFGTKVVAEAARDLGVERVVLISTDKAVRPTNVMGASKRLAELVLQALAQDSPNTVFTMVRFGNVLDSSGSVVRLFRKQIEAGGPVTVTHPDVIRYFMSIPEAAELVIQAGAMATGGDMFLLEMGEPVRIDDLARSMIRLVGLEVRDAANPDGDIAIAYVGLRPGEKLFEELLLGEDITGTEHPRIMKSAEPGMAAGEVARMLEALAVAMAARDEVRIEALLSAFVEGFRAESRAREAAEAQAQPQPPAEAWTATATATPLPRTLH